jgi:uncharacterized protein (TIRG00374 family)
VNLTCYYTSKQGFLRNLDLAQGSKSSKSRRISTILRICVAGAALYFVFRNEDFGELTGTLLGMNLWVFGGVVGILFFSQLIFVSRWWLLLRVQGIRINLWAAFKLHLLGLFYNNFLPTSVGGDVLRAWYVTKHTDKRLEAALSVFVDRVIGFSGLIAMAACFYWLVPVEGQAGQMEIDFKFDAIGALAKHGWTVAYVAGALVAILCILLITGKGRSALNKAWSFLRERGSRAAGKTSVAIRLYCRKPLAILLAYVLTFCCQATFIVGLYFAGRDLGMTAPFKYYFVFFPAAWVLGLLPVSIGGLGIWEGGLKIMFTQLASVTSEQAVALAVCHRVAWLIASLPGVVIHLAGAHLPKEFFVDDGGSVK